MTVYDEKERGPYQSNIRHFLEAGECAEHARAHRALAHVMSATEHEVRLMCDNRGVFTATLWSPNKHIRSGNGLHATGRSVQEAIAELNMAVNNLPMEHFR